MNFAKGLIQTKMYWIEMYSNEKIVYESSNEKTVWAISFNFSWQIFTRHREHCLGISN